MAFLEPGIRDACEGARLVSEERVGAAGAGAQAEKAAPPLGPSVSAPAAWHTDPTPPLFSFLSSDLGFPSSPGARGGLRLGTHAHKACQVLAFPPRVE